jgi:hypothetical protein
MHAVDDELSWDEIVPAEHSAPGAVADLIKTKADAILIHRIIRGEVELLDVGRTQCRSIGHLLQYWDSPDFSEGYARRIREDCDELDVLFREHNDSMALAAVRVPLYAIAFAAYEHAQQKAKGATDDGGQVGTQPDAAIVPETAQPGS